MESAFSRSAQIFAGIGSPVRMYWSALTSYSWKAKSAPAARRTLIASGTTSLPAPSQGRTAIFLGNWRRFLFAQLVALDLAGDGLRQLGHELDVVRVLEALKAGLAVLLQLGRERVTAGRCIGPGDDEGLDLGEAVDLDADHRAFRHRPVLEERRLDLDWRDPQAADLDHVVRAAFVPVVTAVVDTVAVAGEEPVADEAPLGLLVLRPVQ